MQCVSCFYEPINVIYYEFVNFHPKLSYEEYHVRIVNWKEHVLRCRIIQYVKIPWSNYSKKGVTWELEDKMRKNYVQLSNNQG